MARLDRLLLRGVSLSSKVLPNIGFKLSTGKLVASEHVNNIKITRKENVTTIWYNPNFIEKHVTQPEDILFLIAHDLIHHLIGYDCKSIYTSVAVDAVINQMVHQYVTEKSIDMLTSLYGDKSFPMNLLLPNSDLGFFGWPEKKKEDYIKDLYSNKKKDDIFWHIVYGNIWKIFTWHIPYSERNQIPNPILPADLHMFLLDRPMQNVGKINQSMFLGTHPKSLTKQEQEYQQSALDSDEENNGTNFSASEISEETAEEEEGIGLDIRSTDLNIQKRGRYAGHNNTSFKDMLNKVESIESRYQRMIKDVALLAALDKNVGMLTSSLSPERREFLDRSVVLPATLSRKDKALISAGYMPIFFDVEEDIEESSHLSVYIDVSGSVSNVIPMLYGLVISLTKEFVVDTYVFSNIVYPMSLVDLQLGIVQSTGGTDFDCIAEHAKTKDADKILVMTDGYGQANEENKQYLKGHAVAAVFRPNSKDYYDDINKETFKELVKLDIDWRKFNV